jgi:predicted transcriptional regulator
MLNNNTPMDNEVLKSLQQDISDLIQLKLKLAQQATMDTFQYTHFFRNQKPAVPVDQSFTDDYIICLEDGRKVKLLALHLKRKYNMSMTFYIQKWSLPSDYPSVAKNYKEIRKNIAIEGKLGKGTNIKRGRKKKVLNEGK